MLAAGDLLAVAAAAVLVGFLGSGATGALLLVLSAPIWIVTAKLAGLYDRDHRTLRHLTVDELPWLVVWALSSTALLTLLLAPFPALDLSSDDRLLVWGTVLGLGFCSARPPRGLWRRITPPQRVLIVGDGPLAQAVVRKLELFPDIHAEIHSRIPSCAELHERLRERHRGRRPGRDRVQRAQRGAARGAPARLSREPREAHDRPADARHVRHGDASDAHRRPAAARLQHLGHLADDASRSSACSTSSSRRSPSSLTFPLFLLAGLAILLDSGLPIFFRQTRGGERARPFQMLKFRTMVRDAEAMLPELVRFDELDDADVQAQGRPARDARRPAAAADEHRRAAAARQRPAGRDVDRRPAAGAARSRRALRARSTSSGLQVKPGITGPMQVYGRGELTFDERLAVEREYVENLSLARDIRIASMTLPAVLGSAARTRPTPARLGERAWRRSAR